MNPAALNPNLCASTRCPWRMNRALRANEAVPTFRISLARRLYSTNAARAYLAEMAGVSVDGDGDGHF
jgi:hypothetical protein